MTEVRDSDFKNAFPGIFNFTVGILVWNHFWPAYTKLFPLGLLRLFYSELFDASMAVQYLFKSRDAGILQFLGNRLFELDPKDLDFYLPQLLILYLYTEEPTRNCIHPYLVKRYFWNYFPQKKDFLISGVKRIQISPWIALFYLDLWMNLYRILDAI